MFNNNKRKNRIIKRFKESKFNYNKFIKDYYLENNNAYISVKVNNYHDIISKYSIKGYEWINQEFIDYVEENAYYIPIEYNIILEICGKFTKEEKAIINKTIKSYFGIKLGDSEMDLKTNKRNGRLLLLFGTIGIIICSIISKKIETFAFLEPALILLWFVLEEYLDVSLLERKNLINRKLDKAQLSNIKIIFNEEEKDEK